jgi:hypothetical protein
MPKKIVAASLFLLLTSFSLAGKKKPEPGPILPDVTARGRALFEYDEAAWHASDALQATHPDTKSLGRYIAHKSESGWTVAFGHLNEGRDKFIVAYEATEGATLKEFIVRKLDPPREDTSFYLAAAKAIEIALHDFHGEQRSYNVSVLPAPSDQLYVYVLPAQTRAGVYPLGGDVRYLMTADGGAILEKRQLHKSILELGPNSIPKGTTPAGGVHTHVLSDVPEDTDVFHVLTRQPPQPEFIGTPSGKFYEISTDGTIRERK